MKSASLVRYWHSPVRSAIKLLAETALVGHSLESARLRVEHARDILHELCQAMERNGDAEELDTLYVSIFDGLSFCTSVLVTRPFSITLVRQALVNLRAALDVEVRP